MDDTSKLTHSYSHGSSDVPLQFWRCFDRLQHWAEQTPDKDIVVFRQPNAPRQAISFAEFHRLTDGVAVHLIRSQPDLLVNDCVLLMGLNCLEYCAVATGLHKAGLVTVKLHPQKQQSLEMWVRRARIKAVFYQGEAIFQTAADWLSEMVPTRLDFDALIRAGREAGADDSGSRADLLRQRQATLSADHYFAMYPTSGTTGEPKLVPHSHFASVNSVRFRAMSALLTSRDVFFSDRATAHVVGDFGLISAMVMGLTLVTTPANTFAGDRGSLNAAWLMRMLAEESVTSGDFFGYVVHDILHLSDCPPPPCLRSALVAGSLTTSQQMERAMAVLPGIANYYGTTETSMITAVCPPWGPTDDRQARRDTVGRPAMHMEVAVVEPGTGDAIAPLPVGAIGEVLTRGFSVMRGYLDDPVKTREALTPGGWYRTGDLGFIDAAGRVTVTGRIKDIIIRATVNIIPGSIEEVLQAHPDVHAVVVLGVADDRYGEEIAACVVLRPERRARREPDRRTVQELAVWCLARGLKESRDGLPSTPRYWAFLEDFPTSRVGKVVRSEVREHVTCGQGFIDGLEFLVSPNY